MSNLLCAAEEAITMLHYLKEESNMTLTENGGTLSDARPDWYLDGGGAAIAAGGIVRLT